MAFGNDMDAYQGANTTLALVEKSRARTFLGLSWGEAKLLVIAGVGFFVSVFAHPDERWWWWWWRR